MITGRMLQSQVYDFVFHLVDNDPEFTGMDAGDIATKVERSFQVAMEDCLWRTTHEGAK